MSGKLAGKVAWIGGGASGMGEATARLFASEGARVAIADIQAELGHRLVEEIQSQGGQAMFSECDVSSEEQVLHSLSETVKQYTALQIVVNCAGITRITPLDQTTEEAWDQLMGVNLKSIFFSLKHGLPHLRNNTRSYIVNVASISSFVAQASTPVYTVSKHAVLGLTRSIALDYAAVGLRCNAVCPGITDTPMLRKHMSERPDPDMLRRRLRRVPMGVILKPDEVARTMLFLSCEDSAGITGTSLVVDGGYLTAAEWESPENTAFMESEESL